MARTPVIASAPVIPLELAAAVVVAIWLRDAVSVLTALSLPATAGADFLAAPESDLTAWDDVSTGDASVRIAVSAVGLFAALCDFWSRSPLAHPAIKTAIASVVHRIMTPPA